MPINFQDARGTLVFGLMVAFLLAALVRKQRWNLADILILLFALHTAHDARSVSGSARNRRAPVAREAA